MGMPEIDHDFIDELVEESLTIGWPAGSVYMRPMIEVIDDDNRGRISARWPEPWEDDDLDGYGYRREDV